MRSTIFMILVFYLNVGYAENILELYFNQKDLIPDDNSIALKEFHDKFFSRFDHLKSACGSYREYYQLISLGYAVEGKHPEEVFSEIASLATMICPGWAFIALRQHHGEPASNFVNSLTIRFDPWIVAESIYPVLMNGKHQDVYKWYFKNWIHKCVNSNGEAIVGCGL